MKQAIFAAIVAVTFLTSCATQRDGCGTENYKHPFRVQAITPFHDNMYIVHLEGHKPLRYFRVPDSIRVGGLVNL